MSCCGGNCGCGSGCKCGSGCGGAPCYTLPNRPMHVSDGSALHSTLPNCSLTGCKMYPDMSFEGSSTTETLIVGVAPQKTYFEGSEMGAAAENGCKCGSNCQCDPCTCK